MLVTIDNCIRIPLADLRPGVEEEIKRRFEFKNPAYGQAIGRLRAQKKFHSKPYGVPEWIQGWQTHQGNLILPRGASSETLHYIHEIDPQVKVLDNTLKRPPVEFEFRGKLRPTQEPVMTAILSKKFGTICSPTGSGKTVMGLFAISQRKQPTLIVVHTKVLLDQWLWGGKRGEIGGIEKFLGIAREEVGIIGDGKMTVGSRLTIALVQTLKKCAKEVAPYIGHVLVDECHHIPATTFAGAIFPLYSAYSLGLSATHNRRDKLTPLIYWYVGPLIYEVARSQLIQDGDIVSVIPIIRETDFLPSPDIDPAWQRTALMEELTTDPDRNNLIANDVYQELASGGGPCIILSDRKAHCNALAELINQMGIKVEVVHGDVPRETQALIIQAINDGRLQALVGTGQLLGEGFDCKRLSALFLATPIAFSGRLIQYLGRAARAAKGKTSAKVYDYQDIHVDVLMKAARERLRTYNKLAKQDKGPTSKKGKQL